METVRLREGKCFVYNCVVSAKACRPQLFLHLEELVCFQTVFPISQENQKRVGKLIQKSSLAKRVMREDIEFNI